MNVINSMKYNSVQGDEEVYVQYTYTYTGISYFLENCMLYFWIIAIFLSNQNVSNRVNYY